MRIFVAAAVTITSAIGLGTINRRIWLISRPGRANNQTRQRQLRQSSFLPDRIALVGSIAGGLALVA
jgi:hypothetical protein